MTLIMRENEAKAQITRKDLSDKVHLSYRVDNNLRYCDSKSHVYVASFFT